MSNGMSSRTRHIVSGLAAVATTALLMSTLVNSFDARLLYEGRDAAAPVAAATAAVRHDASIRVV